MNPFTGSVAALGLDIVQMVVVVRPTDHAWRAGIPMLGGQLDVLEPAEQYEHRIVQGFGLPGRSGGRLGELVRSTLAEDRPATAGKPR